MSVYVLVSGLPVPFRILLHVHSYAGFLALLLSVSGLRDVGVQGVGSGIKL